MEGNNDHHQDLGNEDIFQDLVTEQMDEEGRIFITSFGPDPIPSQDGLAAAAAIQQNEEAHSLHSQFNSVAFNFTDCSFTCVRNSGNPEISNEEAVVETQTVTVDLGQQLENDLDEAKEALDKLNKVQNQMKAFQSNAENYRNSDELILQASKAESRLSSIQTNIVIMKEEKNFADLRINHAEAEIKDLKNENQKMKERIKALEEEIGTYQICMEMYETQLIQEVKEKIHLQEKLWRTITKLKEENKAPRIPIKRKLTYLEESEETVQKSFSTKNDRSFTHFNENQEQRHEFNNIRTEEKIVKSGDGMHSRYEDRRPMDEQNSPNDI